MKRNADTILENAEKKRKDLLLRDVQIFREGPEFLDINEQKLSDTGFLNNIPSLIQAVYLHDLEN